MLKRILKNISFTALLLTLFTSYGMGQQFRVMSFNILEGGRDKLDTIFQIITAQQADIVLIQESSTLDDQFILKAQAYGFSVVQNNLVKGIFEPAIISKFPIVSHTIRHRSVQALIQLPGGQKIKVHSIHLPPLELNRERITLMQQNVKQYLRTDREVQPVIFGGDLNVWPNNQEVLGQLSAINFTQDVADFLDYIYSFGLRVIPGSSKIIGGGNGWPSDHRAVMVDYEISTSFTPHTSSFSLNNETGSELLLKASYFTDHFPLGSLRSVKFLNVGTKGELYYQQTRLQNDAVVALADLDKVRYKNLIIGLDEIEWIGLTNVETARNSSFLRIENTKTILAFDRDKCLYDVAYLKPAQSLYLGGIDVFTNVSFDSLQGAEFVMFPSYISHFNNFELDNYFSLTLKDPSTLYLAFDNRHLSPPAWIINNFEKTAITFSSNEHNYEVYKKSVPAGEFTFGFNGMNWNQRSFVDHFVLAVLPRKIETIVTVPNTLEKSDIETYPNPFQDRLSIELGAYYNKVHINFTDANGSVLKSKHSFNTSKVQLELDCAPGIYYITITLDDSKQRVIKVVKQPSIID